MASWQLQRGTMTLRPASGGGAADGGSLRRTDGTTGGAGTLCRASGTGSGGLLAAGGSRNAGGFASAASGAAVGGGEGFGIAVHAQAPPAINRAAADANVTQRRAVVAVFWTVRRSVGVAGRL